MLTFRYEISLGRKEGAVICGVALGQASVAEIDRFNILRATSPAVR